MSKPVVVDPQLGEYFVNLMEALREAIPVEFSFSLNTRFWGPKLDFVRCTLDTDPLAFGESGGAEIEEDLRKVGVLKRAEAFSHPLPFELTAISLSNIRFSVVGGESPLEKIAGRFIHRISQNEQKCGVLVLTLTTLVVEAPHMFSVGLKGGTTQDVVVTAQSLCPKIKKRKKRLEELF